MNKPGGAPWLRWAVLLAEDDPDVLLVSEMVLDKVVFWGLEIDIVPTTSARDALDVFARRVDIAVVVMDLAMEHRDAGWELFDAVAREPQERATQRIVRTGFASSRDHLLQQRFVPRLIAKAGSTASALRQSVLEALRAHRDAWLAWRLAHIASIPEQAFRELGDRDLAVLFAGGADRVRRVTHAEAARVGMAGDAEAGAARWQAIGRGAVRRPSAACLVATGPRRPVKLLGVVADLVHCRWDHPDPQPCAAAMATLLMDVVAGDAPTPCALGHRLDVSLRCPDLEALTVRMVVLATLLASGFQVVSAVGGVLQVAADSGLSERALAEALGSLDGLRAPQPGAPRGQDWLNGPIAESARRLLVAMMDDGTRDVFGHR